MNPELSNILVGGIPNQVYDQFIKALNENKVAEDVISRLKISLIENDDISEISTRAALFNNNDIEI